MGRGFALALAQFYDWVGLFLPLDLASCQKDLRAKQRVITTLQSHPTLLERPRCILSLYITVSVTMQPTFHIFT
ncbi:hypothetical protein EDC04DRAFT_2670803 [Pisolithus marmoratus]|nr:hypothetical protein EDC04DRAFT_2670803 [Pisolithus marmoratus]